MHGMQAYHNTQCSQPGFGRRKRPSKACAHARNVQAQAARAKEKKSVKKSKKGGDKGDKKGKKGANTCLPQLQAAAGEAIYSDLHGQQQPREQQPRHACLPDCMHHDLIRWRTAQARRARSPHQPPRSTCSLPSPRPWTSLHLRVCG